jgi:hypothetical protein
MNSLTRAEQLAPFTIASRILKGQRGNGCAKCGQAPLGPNASAVTLDSVAVTNTFPHELVARMAWLTWSPTGFSAA